MKQRPDVDRLLSTWSEDAVWPPAPAYLSKVLERTQRTRQRHAWASLERWLPMTVTTDRPAAPRALRIAWILLIVVALVVVAAGIAIVGSRLLVPAPALPLGGAAVIAFTSQDGGETEPLVGDLYTVRADGTDLRRLTDASSNSRHRPVAAVVARWLAHRLPPLPGGDGLGRGDRRRRRQPDDPVDGCRRARRVLLRARRLLVVGGWADRRLRRPRCCAPANQTSSSSRPMDRRRRRCSCLPAREACFRGSRPTANGSPSWAVISSSPGASTPPSSDRQAPGTRGLQVRRIGPNLEGSPGEQWFPPAAVPRRHRARRRGWTIRQGSGHRRREGRRFGGPRPDDRPGGQSDLVARRKAHRIPPHRGCVGTLARAAVQRCASG